LGDGILQTSSHFLNCNFFLAIFGKIVKILQADDGVMPIFSLKSVLESAISGRASQRLGNPYFELKMRFYHLMRR